MLFHYFYFVLLFAIEFEGYYIHRPYFRIGIYIYVVYLDLYMLLYIDSHISLYLDLCLCSNFYLHMRHHSAAPCAINHVQKRLDLWGKKPVMYRMSMNSMKLSPGHSPFFNHWNTRNTEMRLHQKASFCDDRLPSKWIQILDGGAFLIPKL